MSTKIIKTSESSTSTRSASKKTEKTRRMASSPSKSLTQYGPTEVLPRPSNSRLAEVYQTEEFKKAWANDVRFHVARNLLYLRRYSGKSQDAVAQAMGTSQSAVARIESGQENITLDTLQRHIVALDGRFYISIHPQAYRLRPPSPWWETIASPTNTRWHITPVAARRTEN